jgi:hypothetical protein
MGLSGHEGGGGGVDGVCARGRRYGVMGGVVQDGFPIVPRRKALPWMLIHARRLEMVRGGKACQ